MIEQILSRTLNHQHTAVKNTSFRVRRYGRRPVFLLGTLFMFFFFGLCGVAPNATALSIFAFFAGGFNLVNYATAFVLGKSNNAVTMVNLRHNGRTMINELKIVRNCSNLNFVNHNFAAKPVLVCALHLNVWGINKC